MWHDSEFVAGSTVADVVVAGEDHSTATGLEVGVVVGGRNVVAAAVVVVVAEVSIVAAAVAPHQGYPLEKPTRHSAHTQPGYY